MADANVVVPLKLDAFVLNPPVCSGKAKEAKIAPITQPNYTFLRLDNFVVQNDILDHVDLHHTTPAAFNSRITDLGSPIQEDGNRMLRQRRMGVYLHWMIPRAYRTGTAATEQVPDKEAQRQKRGFAPPRNEPDHSAPDFRSVPPRWLVIRCIEKGTISPPQAQIPEVQAWIIESDRRQGIDQLKEEVDLQVDVSPFIYPSKIVNIAQQAEVFIGYKVNAEDWTGETKADRVPLSLLNSANHLFADYQPHNSNVFSMVDNFEYKDGETTKYLTKAKASYYVIGWHSSDEEDLFYLPDGKTKRQDRLDACLMKLAEGAASEWVKSTNPAHLLCHGAMYDVEWDVGKKPDKVPADDHSQHLNDKMPIAVGTTPLDAILAFVQGHHDLESEPEALKQLEESIIRIQSLLIAQDDAVESQREATDILYNHSYDRAECGTYFHIPGTDKEGQPIKPDQKDIDNLAKLNQVQFTLDLTARTVQRLRWEMFSWWWKYVSRSDDKKNDVSEYKQHAESLTTRLGTLMGSIENLKGTIEDLKKKTPLANPAVLPSVYKQRDPTLLVGGIESGWPYDYLEKLKVRLDTQIIGGDAGPPPDKWNDYIPGIIKKLPESLRESAEKLTQEFLLLRPGGPVKEQPPGLAFPLYHDRGWNPSNDEGAPRRDSWENTQPWFPLFLEWEVEYTHIPYKYWSLEEQTSRQSTATKLRYGIHDYTLHNEEKFDDHRILSGRVLILPQPNFSLQAKIDQLFSTTPNDILTKHLPAKLRQDLQTHLYKLAYLSSPLAGFTDHLLTLVQGTHIKPNKRPPGEGLQPIGAARKAEVGFDDTQLRYIDKESDLTPYGSLVNFRNTEFSPFKPVTHGQFRFTKLNIIDKFGQAIHAIEPTSSVKSAQAFYPCISEFYACQTVPGKLKEANTVVKSDPDVCEFIQLPPQINQFCRLNSTFVTHNETHSEAHAETPKSAYWRPMTEWENPIWGWIVINFAEYGIQIFLPDGTFYREVRFGGPTGVSKSPAWLPFGPQKKETNTTQLDKLLAKLADKTYLQAFVDMINQSLANAPAAPTAYAQFLNSVVGRPLALVNMGWSLELAVDVYVNQSTLYKGEQELLLLPGSKPNGYKFHVKLGDRDRVYDGLVGYFNTLENLTPGNELDLENLYTFFESTVPKSPLRKIGKDNYPQFQPFWVAPDDSTGRIIPPEQIMNSRNSKLTVFGSIIDPFTPVHGYSSFLPTEALTLPPWTWQDAMNKMTAFFHLGPIMITKDVPEYKHENKLKPDYDLTDAKTAVPKSGVPIPALSMAEWSWLQPYIDSESASVDDGRVYTSLGLQKLDNRPRFEEAPYTAIEGYLQLKTPIIKPDVPKKK